MPAIPTRRLLVYIATGIVVLVVGTLGLLSMRSAGPAGGALVIQAGNPESALEGAAGGLAPATGAGDISPSPSTTTTLPRKIWVQVAGAVRRPGVYQLEEGVRLFQAVLEAGGFADDADEQAVALAAPLSDGCRVYVPRLGEGDSPGMGMPDESSAGITGGGAASPTGGTTAGPVSLNTAGAEQLDSLPGIGPSLAQQIIAYRDAEGPFTSVEQLTAVPGIGPAKLEQLRPLVTL